MLNVVAGDSNGGVDGQVWEMGANSIMNIRRIALMLIAAVAPLGFVIGTGTANAGTPSPGDSCPVWHETTTDAAGNTMWCNPTMTGDHNFVWQYGGPA
jgi:hypothetical protein